MGVYGSVIDAQVFCCFIIVKANVYGINDF